MERERDDYDDDDDDYLESQLNKSSLLAGLKTTGTLVRQVLVLLVANLKIETHTACNYYYHYLASS